MGRRFCEVKIVMLGLYGWGEGWLGNDKLARWNGYLSTYGGRIWRAFVKNGVCNLVCDHGGGVLSPFVSRLVLGSEDVKSLREEIAELKALSNGIAKWCGGKVDCFAVTELKP